MGIDYSHYLMIGAVKKKPTDKDWELAEKLEGDDAIDVVSDGMCGEYIVIGKIISQTDLESIDSWEELDITDLQKDIKTVATEMNKIKDIHGFGKPKVLSFIHVW